MKKLSFVFAGLALVASAAFTSCEKDPAPGADEGLKSIALSINFGQTGTKANIDGELESPWADKYSEFSRLDLYFTNANDQIKYYYSAAPDAGDGTNGKIIWDSLDPSATNPNSGVRFIGMEGISKVFVVANGPKISGLTTDPNGTVTSITYISALNGAKLTDYTEEQNTMLYAGAAVNLTLAGTVSDNAEEITVGEEGGQDYRADVTIRPALSRLEVQQAGVVTSRYVYFKTDGYNGEFIETDENDATYRVSFSGFEPSLVGVYASNVYRTSPLFPMQTNPAAGTLFDTPTFENGKSPIAEGKWTELTAETELNSYLSHANWEEGTGYGDLVSTTYSGTTNDSELLLFDGDKNSAEKKVIPFNFFVPYDITSTGSDVTALSGSVMPSLHFQFKEPAQPMNLTVEHKNAGGAWESADQSIIDALEAQVDWPTAVGGEDGIAFANVVRYFTSDALTNETTLKPGYIYRVKKVIVDPTNISISTKDTDAYNVYVVVTVVPYHVEDVYPGFE